MIKALIQKLNAGVAQWQSIGFPSYVVLPDFRRLGRNKPTFATTENHRKFVPACQVRAHRIRAAKSRQWSGAVG